MRSLGRSKLPHTPLIFLEQLVLEMYSICLNTICSSLKKTNQNKIIINTIRYHKQNPPQGVLQWQPTMVKFLCTTVNKMGHGEDKHHVTILLYFSDDTRNSMSCVINFVNTKGFTPYH